MKKLHSIIVLERILLKYDTLGVDHRCPLHHYGLCVEEMLDVIISQLTRLIESKTRLTYRNILVANYKTMTKPQHWLNCQIFDDLPRDDSKKLQQKVFKMVDLMNTLVLKIVKEDGDYTERFFKRLMNSYQRNRATDYCIWKNLQPRITKKMVLEYQAELTADMLIMGILRFDESPTDDEMASVRLDLLKMRMKHNKQYPEDFKAECAKLRRYAYWEGDCFMINYPLIRPYLYKKFDKLTKDQHMALFDYDVQMREIHEDLLAFENKTKSVAGPLPDLSSRNERIRQAILLMREENILKKKSQYGLIMTAMNQSDDLPHFDTAQSFVTFHNNTLNLDNGPSRCSVDNMVRVMRGVFPNWSFNDTEDENEINLRINIGRRFVSAFRIPNNSRF